MSLLVYVFSLFLMLNFSHPLFFWLLMELNLLFFSFVSYCSSYEYKSLGKSSMMFFYFILQSGASLIFLVALFSDTYLFSFDVSSLLLSLIILFKLGLFPFHFWMFEFCDKMPPLEVLFLLIFQKLPFLCFIFYSNLDLSMFIVLFSSLLSCFFLWQSAGMVGVLVSSSIYTTFWLMLFFESSVIFFLIFFSFYFFLTLEGCYLKTKTLVEVFSLNKSLSLFFLLVFLMGLPPFCLFFFKFFSLKCLMDSFSFPFIFFSWILTFGMMMGYFNFFIRSLMISLENFKMSSVFKVFPLSFFLFFFFFFF